MAFQRTLTLATILYVCAWHFSIAAFAEPAGASQDTEDQAVAELVRIHGEVAQVIRSVRDKQTAAAAIRRVNALKPRVRQLAVRLAALEITWPQTLQLVSEQNGISIIIAKVDLNLALQEAVKNHGSLVAELLPSLEALLRKADNVQVRAEGIDLRATRKGSRKQEQVDGPFQQIRNPPRLPDYVERGLRKHSSRTLLESARKQGAFGKPLTLNKYQMVLKRGDATADVYVDAALEYLFRGCFDTAIATLEQGHKQSPPMRWFKEDIQYRRIHADAYRVRTTLTAARDALRKQGINVASQDERIFVAALKAVPKDDHYLAMNLSDAYAASFPKSHAAQINAGETNLTFFENPPAVTNVPTARAIGAVTIGEATMSYAASLDKTNAYPATRLMHHILDTIVKKGNRGAVKRSQLPRMLEELLNDIGNGKATHLTDQEKAFLLYGKAMFYFLGPSWKEPMTDDLISWLTDAIRLDPKAELYADALVAIQANPDELNQRKVAQRELEDEAKQRLYRTVRFTPDDGQQTSPFDGFFYRFQYAVWDQAIKRVSEKDERAGKMIRSIGCPYCVGRGVNLWNDSTCPACKGDGEWAPNQ